MEGVRTTACSVVILDKGKPVARPGRKAREQPLASAAASPAAEGMQLFRPAKQQLGRISG